MESDQILRKALLEIISAKAVFSCKKNKKVSNLFGTETDVDICFNNYNTVFDYQEYLDSLYHETKKEFDLLINYPYTPFTEILVILEKSKFEVMEAKRLFFKEDPLLQLKRIKLERIHNVNPQMEDVVKKKLLEFLWVQKDLAVNLEAFFEHRINLQKEIYSIYGKYRDAGQPENREKTYSQLTLFPQGSNKTKIKWNKDKVALVELLTAMIESGSLTGVDCELTRKDIFAFFLWALNIPIADVNGSLKAAKNRKTVEAPFLQELEEAYRKYREKFL